MHTLFSIEINGLVIGNTLNEPMVQQLHSFRLFRCFEEKLLLKGKSILHVVGYEKVKLNLFSTISVVLDFPCKSMIIRAFKVKTSIAMFSDCT